MDSFKAKENSDSNLPTPLTPQEIANVERLCGEALVTVEFLRQAPNAISDVTFTAFQLESLRSGLVAERGCLIAEPAVWCLNPVVCRANRRRTWLFAYGTCCFVKDVYTGAKNTASSDELNTAIVSVMVSCLQLAFSSYEF